MSRIGCFSMPWSGHFNPLCALAHELAGRGHEVLFFHLPEFEQEVKSRGCDFRAYGHGVFEEGTFRRRNAELSRLNGDDSAAWALETTKMCGQALLAHAGPYIEEAGLDLWVVDHLDYAASILARSMKARFVTVITTLMRHPEAGVPGFSGLPPEQETGGLPLLVKPWLEYLDRQSRAAGLGPFNYETVWSELAQITQQPQAFEFPRQELPECFHFTGPFLAENARVRVSFPWDWLTGAPLVYASLGSVGHGNLLVLQAVVDACEELEVQLVLSVGESGSSLRTNSRVLALPFVPQLELLKRTALMVHHAGMNSTLECLASGVPMVVNPLASDQPGIARRIEWCGVGRAVTSLEPVALRQNLVEVLEKPSFKQQALRFQKQIAQERGLQKAADIIERVVGTDDS